MITESNSSRTYVEVFRGKDGLPGCDGKPGPEGPPGKEGNQGKQGHPGQPGTNCGGATYTRWGHNSCPDVMNTSIVYSGVTAGSRWTTKGGGANYVCLVKDAEYSLKFDLSGPREKSFIYQTEYEYPLYGTHSTNAPCAVCHVSTRSAMIMIPGKTTCPQDWTREYYGYIMTAHHYHPRSMYVCVDRAIVPIPGSSPDHNGALFYHVEAVCGIGLPCPPYDNRKEINCAVCTK